MAGEPSNPVLVVQAPSLTDNAEAIAKTGQLVDWIKRQVYLIVDRDEIRKDRSAVRAYHEEQTRRLRVTTDIEQRRSALGLIDQQSQITARIILSIKRLKDIFVELRREDPTMLAALTFEQFLESCKSFMRTTTGAEFELLQPPLLPETLEN